MGRSATWSAVDEPVTWSARDLDDDSVRAARGSVEQAARHRRSAYSQAFEREWQARQWPREWAEASVSRDYLELLTPDELTQVEQELHSVVERARQRATARREQSSDGLPEEPVFLSILAFPRRSK